jgi:hypothetical protein
MLKKINKYWYIALLSLIVFDIIYNNQVINLNLQYVLSRIVIFVILLFISFIIRIVWKRNTQHFKVTIQESILVALVFYLLLIFFN